MEIPISKTEAILIDILKQSELPDFFHQQIANIIQEESPRNPTELYELIGEQIENGSKVLKEKARETCEILLKKLLEEKIIKTEKKFTHVTEKLDAPVTIQKEQPKEKPDLASEQLDIFLGIEKSRKKSSIDETNKEEEKAKKNMDIIDVLKQMKDFPQPKVLHNKKHSNVIPDISLENINLIVGGKVLLSNAKLILNNGVKYGLIGRNGIGKTCLLVSIAKGEQEKMPKNIQFVLVEQEVDGDEKSPLQTILEADEERMNLLKEEDVLLKSESEESGNRLLEIQKRLKEIDSDAAIPRASQILHGLGFSKAMMNVPTKNLSGGWRMRVAIAKALFVRPDILLLDEPTNHLDLEAVMWLEDQLLNWKNTCIIVSHAREFLNTVCTEIIHFQNEALTQQKGNYDGFEKTRKENLIKQKKQQESQKLKISHMQSFIDRFRQNAKRAALVQSRIKAISKMQLVEDVFDDPSCIFVFGAPEKLRPPLILIENGLFGQNSEAILLKNLHLDLDMESRIAIVGSNGIGKTTFLKLLLGELKLIEGNLTTHPRLRVSFFEQHHIDQLDQMKSPLDIISSTYPGSSIENYRSHLGAFGITGNLQLRPVYLMSGGQKSRVALAMRVWTNPHILIMDEPTNHFDLDAIEALIVALNNYTGGLVIVSHDQHFISSVCDTIYFIKDQRLKRFNGDFEEYRRSLAASNL